MVYFQNPQADAFPELHFRAFEVFGLLFRTVGWSEEGLIQAGGGSPVVNSACRHLLHSWSHILLGQGEGRVILDVS